MNSNPDSTYTFNCTFPPLGVGDYVLTATATDIGGQTATASIHLHVVAGNTRPPNDDFANSFNLAQMAVGYNLNATTEPGEPNHGANAGGHSIWWHWTVPSDGPVVLTIPTSNFSPALAVYQGSQVDQLQQVFDYDLYHANKYSFLAVAGATYRIAVDGIGGGEGYCQLNVRYGASPIVNLSSPHDGDVFPLGASIVFSASVSDADGFATVDGITVDDGNIHVFFPQSSFSYTPPEPGIYSVNVSATDNDGFEEIPNLIHIMVGHGRETVSITSPTEGAVFNAPADIPVHVTGHNFDGTVVQVQLTDGTTTFTSTAMDFDYTFAALDPGNYTLTATATDNTGATASSSVHVSVVTPRPANDDFVNSFDLAQITTGNNVNATREPGEPTNPGGGHSVWWHYTAPSDGMAVFSTAGSSFASGMAIYTGNSLNNLHLVGWYYGYVTHQPAFVWFDLIAGTTYYIDVDGLGNAAGDIQLSVHYDVPPTFTITTPTDGLVFTAPADVPVHVTAQDSDGTVAQINLNLVALSDGTTTSFTSTGADLDYIFHSLPAGNYQLIVRVTDNFGITIPNSVVFSVAVTRPANDNFANSFDLAQITTGNNVNATMEAGEPDHNPNGRPLAGHTVWWHWTAPSDEDMVLSTLGSSFDTVLAVYMGSSIDHLTPPWSNDNWNGTNAYSKVLFLAGAGTTYHIAVDGVSGAWGDVQLNLHYSARPTITLDYPHDGDTIPFGVPIDLRATAGDLDGVVALVSFQIDDLVNQTSTLLFDYTSPYLLTWTPLHPGAYVIQAWAEDDDAQVNDISNANAAFINVLNQPTTINRR
ncbi:MAG: PKD domain-containing protein [Verrucomicrobia bacterium]|nr:PKD domain-containing protein [Verrucomicrobiota bacterium]